jgi:hypothetical protein
MTFLEPLARAKISPARKTTAPMKSLMWAFNYRSAVVEAIAAAGGIEPLVTKGVALLRDGDVECEMNAAGAMPCERLGQCSTAALFNSGEDASFLDAPGAFSLAQRALAPRLDTQDPT